MRGRAWVVVLTCGAMLGCAAPGAVVDTPFTAAPRPRGNGNASTSPPPPLPPAASHARAEDGQRGGGAHERSGARLSGNELEQPGLQRTKEPAVPLQRTKEALDAGIAAGSKDLLPPPATAPRALPADGRAVPVLAKPEPGRPKPGQLMGFRRCEGIEVKVWGRQVPSR